MNFNLATIFLLMASNWPLPKALSVQDQPGVVFDIVPLEYERLPPAMVDQDLVYYHQNKTRNDILRSKTTLVNITCPELNNFTFTNKAPWDILGLPECADKIHPELILYLDDANKTDCILDPKYLPNANTTQCFEKLKDAKDNNKLVILTHGFLNNFDTAWLHQMKDAIQEVENGTAVIIMGWGRGLVDIFSYHTTAANTRYISQALFSLMETMHKIMDRPLYTHCAGHSLGGHVCGFVGKLLKAATTPKQPMFDRISAMDPAGPLFFNDVAYPFHNLNVTSASRLERFDAILVDVIHTDGNARYLGYIPQYGTLETAGTVDFYPGTGKGAYGCFQPGCYNMFDVVSCSHSRAHMLYMASINQADCLASRVCHGDPQKYPNNCQSLRNSIMAMEQCQEVNMGYWWTDANSQPGCYTVEVGSTVPYCK